MEKDSTRILAEIIKKRRTCKPVLFSKDPPSIEIITRLIDIARHAPNHHRTEPARFYLLNKEKIEILGKLFGETLEGDGDEPVRVEKGKRKAREWGEAPGIILVTCNTDNSSDLVSKNPAVIEEDYATCSCICQNLLLLLESENISSKWSTGAVWQHPDFAKKLEIQNPNNERVVAIIFYGYSEQKVPSRNLTPLERHLNSY